MVSINPIRFKNTIGRFIKPTPINTNLSGVEHLDDSIIYLVNAISELQNKVRELTSLTLYTEVDENNYPKDKSLSNMLNGQFLHLTSPGQGSKVSINHGLNRRPIGYFHIVGESMHKVLISESTQENVVIEFISDKLEVIILV